MGLLRFLSFLILLCFCFDNGVEGSHKIIPEYQSLDIDEVNPIHRTGFHFQPQKHWINGPMYFKGIYHLFYQYNPWGAVWGNIVWAHSVSEDMVNWESLEPAIFPSEDYDINGCWSGSATVLPGNKPVIMYTGIDKSIRQIQNYAIPKNASDPYLREWIKPKNNPIAIPDKSENASAFRDPTTAWKGEDGHWRMVVGGKRNRRGMAHLYRSKDFKTWIKAKHPLHSVPHTGMWECPDFYPVSISGTKNGLDTSSLGKNIKHVFKASLDITRYEYYTIGTYLPNKDRYVPDNTSIDGWAGLRYDYGNYYASKTFFDPSKMRRVLWGWANESDTEDDDVAKGWAGVQTIPRTVWLDPNGKQLLQWPIEEIETLRDQKVEVNNLKLEKGDFSEIKGITAAQADVDVVFSFPSLEKAEEFDSSWDNAENLCAQKPSHIEGGIGPFGLLTLASENLEEYTPVFFRIFKAPKKNIDHSIIENFGEEGKTCITSRVYPSLAIGNNAHLYVFNNGSETVTVQNLQAWSMKSPTVMN
ncbi:hypothetical protein F8388_020966 [Cannabis sativa]|uniref:Beta-fructofuranosidase n=1 Tax=Cannabis sativa TaxID=3483 RepID=A0A7J6FMZ6_CANSA|nr:hypothetical protein F8388_020966 [Cannabis sativa]